MDKRKNSSCRWHSSCVFIFSCSRPQQGRPGKRKQGLERATAKESDELTRCSAPQQGGCNASIEPQGEREDRDRRRHRGHGGQGRGRPGSPGHRGTRARQGFPAGDHGKGGADANPRSAGRGRRLEYCNRLGVPVLFPEPLFQLVSCLAWMQASSDDARGQSDNRQPDNQDRRLASWRCPLAMVYLRFPADSCVNRGSSSGTMFHRARSAIRTVSAVLGGGTSKAARHGDAVHFRCAVGHGKPWKGKRERDCGEVTGSCWRVHSGSGPPFPQTMRAKWVT